MSSEQHEKQQEEEQQKQLACPNCGETRFNWVLRQVQSGIMYETEEGKRIGEGLKMREVTDSDLHEKGPWCETCDEHVDVDALVPSENGGEP